MSSIFTHSGPDLEDIQPTHVEHMKSREKITIPFGYEPRDYQRRLLEAIDSGKTRAVVVWHRRSGKDKTCLNIIIKKMYERVGTYYYIFPTYNQGRKILWDGIDRSGKPFLDHFPKRLVVSKNDTEMKIKLENGSIFQIVGSDNIDSIVGTNPIGVVFSEYSLQNPAAWSFIRPILAENEGWAIFVFTPRGENHGYDIFKLAQSESTWFCEVLTVHDTKAIDAKILAQERQEIVKLDGNDALYQQEYECNFQVPLAGAYYVEQIMQAYKDGRITGVPYEDRALVDTWWDLGINDMMAIWFTQTVGAEIRVLDYVQDSGKGLPHYVSILQQKGYVYGRHTAPHDIEVRELTTGVSRRETARNLGIDYRVAPKLPIIEGILACRSIMRRCWFDAKKCEVGLNALKNYRKEYDEKRKTYSDHPLHDWTSNGADAFRTLGVAYSPSYPNQPKAYIPNRFKNEPAHASY